MLKNTHTMANSHDGAISVRTMTIYHLSIYLSIYVSLSLSLSLPLSLYAFMYVRMHVFLKFVCMYVYGIHVCMVVGSWEMEEIDW